MPGALSTRRQPPLVSCRPHSPRSPSDVLPIRPPDRPGPVPSHGRRRGGGLDRVPWPRAAGSLRRTGPPSDVEPHRACRLEGRHPRVGVVLTGHRRREGLADDRRRRRPLTAGAAARCRQRRSGTVDRGLRPCRAGERPHQKQSRLADAGDRWGAGVCPLRQPRHRLPVAGRGDPLEDQARLQPPSRPGRIARRGRRSPRHRLRWHRCPVRRRPRQGNGAGGVAKAAG